VTKIYNRIFNEALDFEIGYKNRKIINSNHALLRIKNRSYDRFAKEELLKIYNDTIKVIIEKHNDIKGEYGFHSKSTGVGGIVIWDRPGDRRADNGLNNFIIKTLLPIRNNHSFTNINAEIIVEKQIIDWAKENGLTGKKRKGLCENIKDDYFSTVFFEGELYDFNLDGYILVD